jgi:hypothetical protein
MILEYHKTPPKKFSDLFETFMSYLVFAASMQIEAQVLEQTTPRNQNLCVVAHFLVFFEFASIGC